MLDEILKDHRPCHDDTQMDIILGGRTEWGRYKQAVRELYKRIRGLRQLQTERKLLQVDIDEENESKEESDFDRRRREIRQVQNVSRMEEITRAFDETMREAKRFYGEAVAIKKRLGEISEEKRRQLDLEDWIHVFRGEAAMGLMANGRVPENTLRHLMVLPPAKRIEVLKDINNRNELFAWAETEWEPATAETTPLPLPEQTGLLE